LVPVTRRAVFEAEGRIRHAPSDEYHHVIARAAPVATTEASSSSGSEPSPTCEQRLAEAASSG
jgi:hypothetical protein